TPGSPGVPAGIIGYAGNKQPDSPERRPSGRVPSHGPRSPTGSRRVLASPREKKAVPERIPRAATREKYRPGGRMSLGRTELRLDLEELVAEGGGALEVEHRGGLAHLVLEDLRPLLQVQLVGVGRRRLADLRRHRLLSRVGDAGREQRLLDALDDRRRDDPVLLVVALLD